MKYGKYDIGHNLQIVLENKTKVEKKPQIAVFLAFLFV